MPTRTQINNFLSNHRDQILALQNDCKALNQKYKQFKRGEYNDSVEVHEYVMPNGGTGYVAYVYAEEGDLTYCRSFHVGEAQLPQLTSWQLVIEGLL